MSRVRDMFISYSELILGICRASEKKISSERAISRSVHGVVKNAVFVPICGYAFNDERMQKTCKIFDFETPTYET